MSFRILRTHRPDPHQHPLIVRLSSGFRRFQQRWYHPDEPLFRELRCGQKPMALVIACSDSRVDPVLLTFPWVKEAVDEDRLALHGWYFDLQSGELLEFDPQEEAFRPLVSRPRPSHEEQAPRERFAQSHHWERHGDDRNAAPHHGHEHAHDHPHEYQGQHRPHEPHGMVVPGKHH